MLNPRLDQLTDYPFQRLRALLAPLRPKEGITPVSMSIGEPRHPYPDFVGDILQANRHLYGKYPPVNGTPELRQAIAAWLRRRYHLADQAIDADAHILPLSGTREGLYMLAQAVVPPRKGGAVPIVAMPNPFYQCYAGAAVVAGGEPVFVPALPEQNFLPDFTRLETDWLNRLALVYLCSPANPQGSVADFSYLSDLITLAQKHDFVLAVDECYAEIYNDAPPIGALEVAARTGLGFDNLVVFHSLSKRSSVPGLRSGFCAGDAKIIAALTKLRGYGGAPSPLPISMAATALWQDEHHVIANRALYREKFDLAEKILGNRFGFYKPAGGFFLWLDVGDGETAAKRLYEKAALTVLPGAYLTRAGTDDAAGRPYLRVALVGDLEETRTALSRLGEVL